MAWPTKDMTSETAAKHLSNIIELFGIPKTIKTDGGSCFKANNFTDKCRKNNIVHKMNIAYQPEWLGKVERMNQNIRYSLARSCDGNYESWKKFISKTLRGIRSRNSSNIGYSRHELMFGVRPRMSFQEDQIGPVSLQARLIESVAQKNKRRKLLRPSEGSSRKPTFDLGDMVMVSWSVYHPSDTTS
ncbi:Pro-Pol polyprotein [Smittium culicis]|uniref:Pro-Pol polyprotein n=1 Tax=Smittium culicis TaxID=133412 RepID=A0A1R1YPH6_9FUNG|nr:Pro-Pol polyprotein [Smittium culicis]